MHQYIPEDLIVTITDCERTHWVPAFFFEQHIPTNWS